MIHSMKRFAELCHISVYPVNFGCCRSQCCCKMISLFHEPKQMGLVLGTSFKGRQVWIPPIPKQLEDIKNLKQLINKLKDRNSKD